MSDEKANRIIEPICPHCGSSSIREWGSVEVSYEVESIEITADGQVECVQADEPSDTAWDSYTSDSYMCRNCDATLTEEQMVEVALAKPHVVMLENTPVERFATVREAEAYRASVPESIRARTWISTPRDR